MTLRAIPATGVGSLPGSEPLEWCRIIAGELPELPHVPELPQRGPGADMIGRALAILAEVSAEFASETTPDGWRLSGRLSGAPRVMRRAQSWLREDLDAAEAVWGEFTGPLKLQVAGPLTLAAAVELPTGERLISDPTATSDMTDALAAATEALAADAARRFPRCALVLQLDEPYLPAVLDGRIKSQSGARRYAPIPDNRVVDLLQTVMSTPRLSDATVGVHCCAGMAPVRILQRAGVGMISVDLTRPQSDEELAGAIEAGTTLLAGLDVAAAPARGDKDVMAPLADLFSRTGLSPATSGDAVIITPRCGLTSETPGSARGAYERAAALGRAWQGRDRDVAPDGPRGGS